jgi:hypothetical protein
MALKCSNARSRRRSSSCCCSADALSTWGKALRRKGGGRRLRPSRPAERHQTALRGQAASSFREGDGCCSTSNASETSPCRRAGQAKRRARPPQGDGLRQAQAGGIETSIAAGQLPSAASAQLVCTRRRAASHLGRSSKSGRRRQGQSNRKGSGLCRSATGWALRPTRTSRSRGRQVPS